MRYYFRWSFLFFLIIHLFSCSSEQKRPALIVLDETVKKHRIDSAIFSIIDKYDLLYYPQDISRDEIDVQKCYPLLKKTHYPFSNLTIENHFFLSGHQKIELIICYNKYQVTCIPFVGVSYFKNFLSDSYDDFSDIFENELSASYQSLMNIPDSVKSQHFLDGRLFPKRVLEGIEMYKINEIRSHWQLNAFSQRTLNSEVWDQQSSLIKKRAMSNIDSIAKNALYHKNMYYSVNDYMLLEFKTKRDSLEKSNYNIETINFDMYREYIF